jgi:hypothetical protein
MRRCSLNMNYRPCIIIPQMLSLTKPFRISLLSQGKEKENPQKNVAGAEKKSYNAEARHVFECAAFVAASGRGARCPSRFGFHDGLTSSRFQPRVQHPKPNIQAASNDTDKHHHKINHQQPLNVILSKKKRQGKK